MQPNDAEVQDGVASYLQNSLKTRAGLDGSLLVSLASLLQRLLPRWLTQHLFRWKALICSRYADLTQITGREKQAIE